MIDVPLDDDANLYDTPGIINRHQMAHYVDARDLKTITPKKEIKPHVFQLNPQQTLFFGGVGATRLFRGQQTLVRHLYVKRGEDPSDEARRADEL